MTTYKIQEKVCHITHMSGLFNFQSVIYTVREGIFCKVEYFQEICLHLKSRGRLYKKAIKVNYD